MSFVYISYIRIEIRIRFIAKVGLHIQGISFAAHKQSLCLFNNHILNKILQLL